MKNAIPELVTKTKEMINKKGLAETLEKFPQSLLIIRLGLGKSQRDFIKLLKGSISQPILIKHEKGETKKMTRKLAKKISKKLEKFSLNFDIEKIKQNFKKFKNMQKGHMTSEEGRRLQKIWMRKTTKEQRKLWGKLGAEIAIKHSKLMVSELRIKKILEELNLPHKVHHIVKIDQSLNFNVDFLIENREKIAIEVTEKQNNLTVTAQALAFRSLQIKKVHPETITVCIIPTNMTPMGKEVLNRTFDKVFSLSELEKFKEFLLKNITFSI